MRHSDYVLVWYCTNSRDVPASSEVARDGLTCDLSQSSIGPVGR